MSDQGFLLSATPAFNLLFAINGISFCLKRFVKYYFRRLELPGVLCAGSRKMVIQTFDQVLSMSCVITTIRTFNNINKPRHKHALRHRSGHSTLMMACHEQVSHANASNGGGGI